MGRYLNRHAERKLHMMLSHFPVVAVLGARQVGKSTLVDHLNIPGLHTTVFDPVVDVGGARQDPDFFLQNHPTPAFLDEIQYAPELLATIKRRVDRERRPGTYIISGSQNLAVLRGIAESLAGRVAILRLWAFTQRELSGRINAPGFLEPFVRSPEWDPLEHRVAGPTSAYEAIHRGGMPGLLDLPSELHETYFDSYRQTYIERDVRKAADIGALQTFGRFYGLLAALSARELNHNQLGRELGIDRKSAKRWTEIASATYQWHELPAYSLNAIKRLSGKPKGYFADTGLACHLQGITTPRTLAQHPLSGHLFETFVVLEILKGITTWSAAPPSVYHFRAHSGAEVDLILEQDGLLFPIEVKMKARPTKGDCRGIHALPRHFPSARIGRGLVVCATEEVQRLAENVYAVPWWAL